MPLHDTASGLRVVVTTFPTYTTHVWREGDCDLVYDGKWLFEYWDNTARQFNLVDVPDELATLDDRIAWCEAYYQMVTS